MGGIAVIPAIRMSYIPGEGMIKIGQKSLIQHILDKAKQAGLFDKIMILSDWECILEAHPEATRLAPQSGFTLEMRDQVAQKAAELLGHPGQGWIALLDFRYPLISVDSLVKAARIIQAGGCQSVAPVFEDAPYIMTSYKKGNKDLFKIGVQRFGKFTKMMSKAFIFTQFEYLGATGKLLGQKGAVLPIRRTEDFEIRDPMDYMAVTGALCK